MNQNNDNNNNQMTNNYDFEQMSNVSVNHQVNHQMMNMNVVGMEQNISSLNSNNNTNKKNVKKKVIIGFIIIVLLGIVSLFLINKKSGEKVNNDNNSDISNDLITNTDENAVKVAVIGHFDHGKSTLTSAITKVYGDYVSVDEIDKGIEERKKGITIKLARVKYKSNERVYEQYDFPYHEDYLKAFLSGAYKFDGAILVVSATDGPMAETLEQLKLAKECGISKIVVYISKCDMVKDKEIIELVELEVKSLIDEYGFDKDNTPIIKGSALNAIKGDKKEENNIRDLVKAMDSWNLTLFNEADEPFLLSVEDVFNITGRGTIATGRVERGTVEVGDKVQIVGFDNEILTTEIIGMEKFREETNSATVGDNLGVYLKDITKDKIQRGQVIVEPDSIKQSNKFEAEVYFLKKDEVGIIKEYVEGDSLNFNFRINDVLGTIDFFEDELIISSGQIASFIVNLNNSVAMEVGTRFYAKYNDRTIGIGMVTKVY